MPHIAVSLYAGRDDETKLGIAEKVEEFFASTLGFPADAVSVSIVDLEPDAFVSTVQEHYRPEELFVASRLIRDERGTGSAAADVP